MDVVTLQALPAGSDVEFGWRFIIPELVDSGKLNIRAVDTAVKRVLKEKFEMALSKNPCTAAPQSEWHKLVHTKEVVDLARELDRESIVLLENHYGILPLNKDTSIDVIGLMAHGFMNVSSPYQNPIEIHDSSHGDYSVYESQHRGVIPLDGIKAVVGDKAKVHYAKSCE
ncbi:hypothetical protein EYZ11_007383 [Aspergillus tanneri]|uniref:Uncharacterized protein n=1 Tax=Aspergillus tanneri TaxID=1220188 RepID=A0A4S3JDC6_9EURO|nr:uncharacterized protein ATNIH1004_006353 [Aspergillus tanneri]KAA8647659.1 hypothetical protein ATNIH1004_006353 [Aspergillus tanneri]THC93140.1 hypothetical protein EYZ11_007383 [Aspergillus tanneri]